MFMFMFCGVCVCVHTDLIINHSSLTIIPSLLAKIELPEATVTHSFGTAANIKTAKLCDDWILSGTGSGSSAQ